MDQHELTPPCVRYFARLIRPYPNWDFFFMKSVRQERFTPFNSGQEAASSMLVAAPAGRFPV